MQKALAEKDGIAMCLAAPAPISALCWVGVDQEGQQDEIQAGRTPQGSPVSG